MTQERPKLRPLKVRKHTHHKHAANLVLDVAEEILDEIIAPTVGIKGVWADFFLATPSTYTSDRRGDAVAQRKKIILAVAKRYDGDVYALARAWRQPLALFAVVAMSQVHYTSSTGKGKSRRPGAKEAWELLAEEDKRLARQRKTWVKRSSMIKKLVKRARRKSKT